MMIINDYVSVIECAGISFISVGLTVDLQFTVTCTVLTSGGEMSFEEMHSYDPDCSLVIAVISTYSPSLMNLRPAIKFQNTTQNVKLNRLL